LADSHTASAFSEEGLRWEDRTGLPSVHPYLDDEFVMLTARLPTRAIFAGARERGLLRESMEGLVPDSVRYRKDKAPGEPAFAEAFVAMGGYESVRDLVTMRELEKIGVINGQAFRAAFERFAAAPLTERASSPVRLWRAIVAEAYVRWFNGLPSRASRSPARAEAVL
jgi:hypothetical protein